MTQLAHTNYYLTLAQASDPYAGGPEESVWLDRLERERDNFRAALQWAIARGEAEQSMEMALELGVALQRFWLLRGNLSEGRRMPKCTLAKSEDIARLLQAQALEAAGMLAFFQDDDEDTEVLCGESLVRYRQLGYTQGIAASGIAPKKQLSGQFLVP